MFPNVPQLGLEFPSHHQHHGLVACTNFMSAAGTLFPIALMSPDGAIVATVPGMPGPRRPWLQMLTGAYEATAPTPGRSTSGRSTSAPSERRADIW